MTKYELTLNIEVSNMEEWKFVSDLAMAEDSKHWWAAGTYDDEGIMYRDMEWLFDTKLEALAFKRKLKKAFFRYWYKIEIDIDEFDENELEEEIGDIKINEII